MRSLMSWSTRPYRIGADRIRVGGDVLPASPPKSKMRLAWCGHCWRAWTAP